MPNDLAEMRDRQDRLEDRVTVLEVTVQKEAALRAKMDSDLGDVKATLNAHTGSLQALHDTQSDHTRRLTRIEDRLGNVEDRLGNVEEQLGTVRVGVHAILDLLDAHLARKPWWAGRRLRLSRPQ